MKRILILVDNSRRDLLPCVLLKLKFEELGCNVELCNKRNFKIIFRKFKPDAFLITRGDFPFIREMSKVCKIFLIPAEGARLTPETMKSVFLGRMHNKKSYDQTGDVIDNLDFLDMVYLWGDRTKRFLVSTGMIKSEKLKVVGNGRLDVYRDNRVAKERKDHDFTIGIAFSIKSMSVFEGRVNYLKLIFGFFDATKSMQFPMVPEGRHYEDYVWRDFAIARKMLEVILSIIYNTNHKIKLRIGPFENPNDYKFLTEEFPGRIFIQGPSEQLVDYLNQVDMLITCWSTTGLEAVLMGKPVIAIPYLIEKEHLLRHVEPVANGFDSFLKLYYTPYTIEEVLMRIQQTALKELDTVSDKEFFEEFIKDVYNWPTDKSTTDLIVSDILNELSNNSRIKISDFSKYAPFSPMVEKMISAIPLPENILVYFINLTNNIKTFIKDVRNGKFFSSRMHYQVSNAEVEDLAKRTSNFL